MNQHKRYAVAMNSPDGPETKALAGDEDVIQKRMGKMGIWQISISLFICLLKFPTAWNLMSIIFIAPKMDYYCVGENGAKLLDIHPCSSECPRIEFNRSVFTETIQTEWHLVCEKESYVYISQALVMLGVLIGSFVFGYLSDNYGRYKPFCGAILAQLIFGIVISFVPYLWMFLLLRLLIGTVTAGFMLIGWVIILEIIGKDYRELFTVIFYIPFNFGLCLMPLFAYYYRDWRHFMISYCIPTSILLLYFFTVPESPRWLISKNRVNQATKVIERAAKWNKLPTENIRTDVLKVAEKFEPVSGAAAQKYGVLSLLRTPNMRRKSFALWANWFAVGCVFYGLLQYIGHSAGDVFMDVFITNAIQIPGSILCVGMLRYLGRKKTTIIANLMTAIATGLIAVVPADYAIYKVYLAVIGLCGMNILFPAVYLYTGEVCPTVVRNIGFGTSSTISRIGGILAPFILSLKIFGNSIPPLIFATIALVAAIFVFWLPETLNRPLPDTLEDGENFGKKR